MANNTLNNYKDAEAHAYRILNRVQDKLAGHHFLLNLCKWSWTYETERHGYTFKLMHENSCCEFFKKDNDMFDDEFYEECANTLVPWLLIQGKLYDDGANT